MLKYFDDQPQTKIYPWICNAPNTPASMLSVLPSSKTSALLYLEIQYKKYKFKHYLFNWKLETRK